MFESFAIPVLIALALVFANAPFMNLRLAAVGPRQSRKSLAQCLLECAGLYVLWALLGVWLESVQGQVAPQRWEFYAITSTLFLTLAFPGFVFRFLLRPAH